MNKQKLSDLAKKRGIYAVLLVGVFVVVAVVMVMMTNNTGKTKEENPIDLNESPNSSAQQDINDEDSTYADDNENPDVAINDPNQGDVVVQNPEDELAEITPIAEVTTVPTTEPVDVADTNENNNEVAQTENHDTKPVMQTNAKNLVFHKEDGLDWPVKGNIILPYSVDKTTYYATLKQYMTNPAILIASEIGTEVKASAKGIVTDIKEDARTGNTITMDIGSGFKVVYGQLEGIQCKVGDTINAGATLGKVSKVTKYFVIEGAHLYFQVFEGDSTVDPMTLLKAE